MTFLLDAGCSDNVRFGSIAVSRPCASAEDEFNHDARVGHTSISEFVLKIARCHGPGIAKYRVG